MRARRPRAARGPRHQNPWRGTPGGPSGRRPTSRRCRGAGLGVPSGTCRAAAPRAPSSSTSAAGAAAAPPAPAAKAKAKAKAAAAAPEPQPTPPQGKAKAKGKAKAVPEPPVPEPKAEAKAKAKGKAKAQPEPPAPVPVPVPVEAAAPKAKAAGKQKAKAAKPVEEVVVQEKPKKEEEFANYVIDDGSGEAWETSTGLSKKLEKRKQKMEEATVVGPNGQAMPANQQQIVGMGPQGVMKAAAPKSKGASQSVAADVERILNMKNPLAVEKEEKPKEPEANLSTVTIHVPEPKIGIIIGPKGSKIKMIQEKTGVTRIDTAGSIFTITGEPKAVSDAETAIKEMIEKGYCSMMFEGFSENIINVHTSSFPDLIGKQGAIVRKIKEELNVEINFQDVPKGSAPTKKGKVTLAGKDTDVEKAKAVINNIIMYCHDDLTHPGFTHAELDIEPWAYRYLIGSKGSEMKHIQHNWKVKVNIPRETSANDKVLIVGEADQVERAKTYCEKLIWNAENNSKGRDKADGTTGDSWGDEEPEEEWMKGYMYKR
mmetsp:Transcript_99194/g.318259  ORF Transcript_99194/g.318259 Transcript_99194/m.318259 type:complete len:542 (+) Transcript_99194:1314-2939(+)